MVLEYLDYPFGFSLTCGECKHGIVPLSISSGPEIINNLQRLIKFQFNLYNLGIIMGIKIYVQKE